MREATDVSLFLKEEETSKTRAYDHALDLAFLFVDEMERRGLTKSELAKKMGIPIQRLSKLLNTQPNMTLETIARFELALDINIQFKVSDSMKDSYVIDAPQHHIGFAESCNLNSLIHVSKDCSSKSKSIISGSQINNLTVPWEGILAA